MKKRDRPINPELCKECELFKKEICNGYHPDEELMTIEECDEMQEWGDEDDDL